MNFGNHYHSLIQEHFIRILNLFSCECSLTASGTHCCTFWHCNFAFSRMSYKWAHTVWGPGLEIGVYTVSTSLLSLSGIPKFELTTVCLPVPADTETSFGMYEQSRSLCAAYVLLFLWDKYLGARCWGVRQSSPLPSLSPVCCSCIICISAPLSAAGAPHSGCHLVLSLLLTPFTHCLRDVWLFPSDEWVILSLYIS